MLNGMISSSFTQIDPHAMNIRLLEHEIKTLVDSTRISHNLPPLFNDSILYVASQHHSNYLVKLGDLSHYEEGKQAYYSPQDRARSYGAPESYLVGENVVYANYNARVRVKGREFETSNYNEMARCLVYSWIRSRGHFKNMIDPDYQVTGLSIGIDTVNQRVYSCQKFAKVLYKYDFVENKNMFPYSGVDREAVNAMLSDFPRNLSYPHGLRYDEKEKCDECKEIWEQYPHFSVRIKRNAFYLRVEEASFVQELIQNRRDGFAVEVVPFDPFACGNPAYYEEPSRRNGEKRTSGIVLEPVYRKDLMKGFKRRKRKDNIRFVNYILSADSVSFFKRFGRYRMVNFDAKYFEIKLGRVPKDVSTWWNHNLVYIHNKQLCHFVYLTNYPGELDLEMIDVPYYPPLPFDDYEFQLEHFSDTLELFYDPGATVTKDSELNRMIKMYQEKHLRIESVDIHGYCSVEGDEKKNEILHQQRATNILSAMKDILTKDTVTRIRSEVAWGHFYSRVKDDSKWNFLYDKSRKEIQRFLTDPNNERPLDILKEERKVKVVVVGTRDLNKSNALYYIQRDLNKMFFKTTSGQLECLNPDSLTRLYEKAYYFSTVDSISVEDFLSIHVPDYIGGRPHRLDHDIAFYRYNYLKDKADESAVVELESQIEFVFEMCGAADHLSPQFHYLSACLLVDRIRDKQNRLTTRDESIQKAFDRLNLLLSWYDLDEQFKLDVARANLNIINILMETIDGDQIFEYNKTINASLVQIVEYYRNTNQLTAEKVVQLSKLLCYFQNVGLAVELCRDFLDDNDVLQIYLPLAYQHSSFLSSDAELLSETVFLQLLKEAKARLTGEEWCRLFYGQYGIPFQVMDDESLRKLFCETCPNRVDEVFSE